MTQPSTCSDSAEPDILEALTHEHDALRKKIDIVVGTQHKCFFTMVTAASAASAVYYSNSLITNASIRLELLLIVSQVVLFIALIAAMMTALLAMLAGHVEAIEHYTNIHLTQNVCIFENYVVRTFMISAKSVVLWITIGLSLFPALFLAFCISVCIRSGLTTFGLILATEMTVLIVIFALLIPLRDKVSQSAKEKMANNRIDHDFGKDATVGGPSGAVHP